MKLNLKNFLFKNNLVFINLITVLFYSSAWLINYFFNNTFLLNIIGIFYLLFLIPLDIISILKLKLENWLDYFFGILVVFFTLYIPLYFVANYLGFINLNQLTLIIINFAITLITIIYFFNKKDQINFGYPQKYSLFTTNLIKEHWPILLTFLIYGLIHLVNYHFYIFIPEWDGYTKMIEIKKAIEFNKIMNSYRGFFSANIIVITQFAQLSLYSILSWFFIALEASPLLVFYYFIRLFKLNSKFHQFIVLIATLAVPVINMETDIIRPQSIFLILFPIYVFFIFKAWKKNNPSYWFLASLIAIMGLNYHEFFVFIFGFHLIILFLWLYQNFYSKNRENKIIFWLSSLIILLFSFILTEHFPLIQFGINTIGRIFHKIIIISKWRWWFLGNYSGDISNYQVGWPGIIGALKYYAYYTSPLVFYIIILSVIYYHFLKRYFLVKLSLSLIFLLLIYTEVLPRLNYIYLPERIWIIIDIATFFLLIPLFSVLKKKINKKQFQLFFIILIALILIGISGSFYVANQKKALTSQNEFKASQWIKKNTPSNSIIITQEGNQPLVKYFANRKIAPFPGKEFFDGDTASIRATLNGIISQYYYQVVTEKLPKNIQIKIKTLKKKIKTNPLDNPNEIKQELKLTQQLLNLEQQKLKYNQIRSLKLSNTNQNKTLYIYALYSEDKFKGLYAQREWWLKANYYKAHLENLTKKYPLVYNKNGIYIWKIKEIK